MSVATENTNVVETTPDVNNVTAEAIVSTSPEKTEEKTEVKSNNNNLTPAPLPTSSPWKAVTGEIPVTTISTQDLDSARKKNKSPAPVIKSSTSTKWLPMKASITVSGTRKVNGSQSNNQNKKSNSKNNRSNNSNNSTTSSNNNSQRKKKTNHSHSQKKTQKANKESNEKLTDHEEQEQNASTTDSNEKNQQSQHHHNRPHRKFNNRNGQNGYPNRRFHNKNGFQRSFNPNFQPKNQQMVQLQNKLYPIQPAMMAINNIARQIEYYFSEENLSKDTYLRAKFSKDGYVSLGLLAKFYRVVNMSFGGDSNVILAALREIVFNENATVDVASGVLTNPKVESEAAETTEAETESPLDKYFVRSKAWEQWVPETVVSEITIENVLTGNALDEFMVTVLPLEEQAPVQNASTEEQHEQETPSEEQQEVAAEQSS